MSTKPESVQAPATISTYRAREKFHEERIRCMRIVAEGMNDEMLVKIADKIDQANNVFVAALGRSRLNIMAFATRLMQMGISAHVVGDNSTPSIHRGDLFIIGSSSGKTSSLVEFAKRQKPLTQKSSSLPKLRLPRSAISLLWYIVWKLMKAAYLISWAGIPNTASTFAMNALSCIS